MGEIHGSSSSSTSFRNTKLYDSTASSSPTAAICVGQPPLVNSVKWIFLNAIVNNYVLRPSAAHVLYYYYHCFKREFQVIFS